MKKSFKIFWKIYLLLLVIYTMCYWTFIVIDDYGFIEKYWATHWLEYIAGWSIWYAIFLVGLTIYYWIPASLLILIYHKWIKKTSN